MHNAPMVYFYSGIFCCQEGAILNFYKNNLFPLIKRMIFVFIFLVHISFPLSYANDVYFIDRNGHKIELSEKFKNIFNNNIISENNKIEPESMPSAHFYPLGYFVNKKKFAFYLFHIKDLEEGYYYDFSHILPQNKKSLISEIGELLLYRRKLNQTDIKNIKELFISLP